MRSLVFWSRLTLIGAIKSSGHQAGFSPVVPRFCRITSRTPASPQTKRIQISPLRCHGSGDVMLSDVSPNIGESHWCHVCLLLMGRTRSRTDRSRTAGLQRRSPPTRFLCCGCRCGQRWPRPPRTPAETHTHTVITDVTCQSVSTRVETLFTQQDPQFPWSRIWPRLLQYGHSDRGSKLSGSFTLVACFTLQMENISCLY